LKKLVIIPAYNEEKSISKVVEDIIANAKSFDYIIINDCSTDGTKRVCEEKNFNHLNLPINLGIGGCVQTGYKFALKYDYDIAVQFDGDGQHDASFLELMEKKIIDENADMVIGSRFIKNEGFQSSFARRIGINFFKILFKILYKENITDATSGLRMVNRNIIKDFCKYYPIDYPEPETTARCLKNRCKIVEIPVIMNSRIHGVSSINFIKSVYYMIKVSLAIIIDYLKRG